MLEMWKCGNVGKCCKTLDSDKKQIYNGTIKFEEKEVTV